MQLGEDLQTTCLHCGSVFRITQEQLEAARGQARCNQCMQVFNALFTLENYSAEEAANAQPTPAPPVMQPAVSDTDDAELAEKPVPPSVTLNEAMFGDSSASRHSFKPILWLVGILLLVIISVVQLIYYQRYSLVASSQYQQQILNLCRILPCDESRFSNLSQIRLIERNVFSHPIQDKALMISGSFINGASFNQSLPRLLVSLSDVKGNLIANRLFQPAEYLVDHTLQRLQPGKAVQFRLEIFDPGTEALTYEFEFVS